MNPLGRSLLARRAAELSMALVLLAAPFAQSARDASAAAITSLPAFNCGGGPIVDLSAMRCTLTAEYPSVPNQHSRIVLFDQVSVGPNDTGLVFSADSLSNGQFDAFVTLLTNGLEDVLRTSTRFYGINYGGSAGNASPFPESRWFAASPTLTGIDLIGYEVTSIDLRVDSVTVDYPCSDCVFPNFSVRASLVFNGSLVPEPSGAALVSIGLLQLIAFSRIRVYRACNGR